MAELRMALRRFLAATDEVTRAEGLTPRQYDLLALLHAPSPHVSPSAIADALCLSRSATTELLSRAADAGLVHHALDAGDARFKQIVATKEGSRRFFAAVNSLRAERTRLLELLAAAAGIAASLST